MADVKMCDRCGMCYAPTTKKKVFVMFCTEKDSRDITRELQYFGMKLGDMVDLCEACNNELKEWMDSVQ